MSFSNKIQSFQVVKWSKAFDMTKVFDDMPEIPDSMSATMTIFFTLEFSKVLNSCYISGNAVKGQTLSISAAVTYQ